MSTIELQDGGLTLRLTVAEKILAVHGNVHVTAAQVVRASSLTDPWLVQRGLRLPGLGLPGVAALGTWRWRNPIGSGRDFLVVRGHGPGVLVDLRDHEFDRLLLSVADPAGVVVALR